MYQKLQKIRIREREATVFQNRYESDQKLNFKLQKRFVFGRLIIELLKDFFNTNEKPKVVLKKVFDYVVVYGVQRLPFFARQIRSIEIGQDMPELTPAERTTDGYFLTRDWLSWLKLKEAGSGS